MMATDGLLLLIYGMKIADFFAHLTWSRLAFGCFGRHETRFQELNINQELYWRQESTSRKKHPQLGCTGGEYKKGGGGNCGNKSEQSL
jgi:hypothetical protein